MKITADTNVLVRVVVRDDRRQASVAEAVLANAEMVVLTLPTLCEFVWVLSKVYRYGLEEISAVIRALLGGGDVGVSTPAVEAGLAMLDAGGDFADGVIAYEGRRLGAEAFVSFDRKAVRLLEAQGEPTQLLS